MTPKSDGWTCAATASSSVVVDRVAALQERVPRLDAARVLRRTERGAVTQVRERGVADRRRCGDRGTQLGDISGEAATAHRRLEEEHADVGVREQIRQLRLR